MRAVREIGSGRVEPGPAPGGSQARVSSGARIGSGRVELGEEWAWLFPSGLRRGRLLSLGGDAALSLALALGARVAGGDGWMVFGGSQVPCAAAVVELGARPDRFVSVKLSGDVEESAVLSVCAGLVDVFDVVIWSRRLPRAGRKVGALEARLRRSGACLLYLGDRVEGEEGHLQARTMRWVGLGRGWGHLRGRLVWVRPSGRLVALGAREGTLWLPDFEGKVTCGKSSDEWVPNVGG